MSDLHLRPADPDDSEALAGLLDRVFPDNPKADPAVLRWQFWDNPAGRAASWVFEDADGRLVSHFAVLPVRARLDGRPITAAKPADAATLPEHRGQGLMGRAARAVFEECRERDIPVTICLPNPQARGALRKIGMVEVAPVRAYVAPLDDGWLADRFGLPRMVAAGLRRAAFRLPDPGSARRVDRPPEGLDDLWAVTEQEVPNGIVHDARWWEWRYARRPSGDYRYYERRDADTLVAAATTTVRESFGGRFVHVLDVQARDGPSAREVLGRALRDDEADGAATIGLPGTRVARLVGSAGLRRLPRVLEPNEQILGLMHNDPDVGDLSDRRWSVAWTDLDHL